MPAFDSLALSPDLLEVVRELGYTSLTPIQAKSIPLLLEGRDLVGQSKTGSGKTASFALPILENVSNEAYLQALVLCPTRELCTQVAREIRKLGRKLPGLQVAILAGGVPIATQLGPLDGAHIAVGTPGRVIDHLSRRTLDLRRLRTVVLDEADRMLDMGFQDDMERILRDVPKNRQTVFFSATFPSSIEAMSRAYQRNPVRVTIEEAKAEAGEIRQVFYEAEPETKASALVWLLQQNQPESAIVFCNLKATVGELAEELENAGVSVDCIHGDLEQRDRDRVMAKFRNRSTRVLIATDVAARGIDIENLDIVFNFDIPKADVYVHRIGRTGRAGKKGLAISIGTAREKTKLEAIEKFTGKPIAKKTVAGSEQLAVETAKTGLHRTAAMETLQISGGRKEKVRAGDILGALTGEGAGLKGSDVGKIEIHDHFAYVAVSANVAPLAVQRLSEGKIKGKRFRVRLVK